MAIGDVKASGGLGVQLISDRSSEITAQATSGLGNAVNALVETGLGYLNSRTDIEKIYDDRAMKSEGLEVSTAFLEYQTARAKEFTEFSRARSADPRGMTQAYDTELTTKEEEFLATVPERHREEYRALLRQDHAQRVGSAFTSELTLLDEADTNNLNNGLNTLGSALKGKQTTLEDAQAEWAALVEKSTLPAETKQQFIENGNATLQGLEFGTIVEEGAAGYGTVSDGTDGSDVSAAGLMPQERGVLNVIASGESPGYNVWNGGTTFSSYEDHPAASGSTPGESSAAGRYQFILGTWRAATASYERTYGVKVPDFSPEWQDRVALHWAEKRFNELNGEGLTFKGVLASGDPQQILKIKTVLGKPRGGDPNAVEWEGLGHVSDSEFLEIFTGQKGIAGGGTGPATMPNVWTDPRFAGLDLDTKLSFANKASAAVESQKQEMGAKLTRERSEYLDSAYNAGFSGDASAVEGLKNSPYWGAEAQAKFDAGMEVYRKSESDGAAVTNALVAGTPMSASQMGAFGKWFGQESFAGIMDGSAEAYKKMQWAVGQARIFPEGAVDAFRAAMANPNTAPKALELLASAYAGDESILRRSGFTKEDIAAVNLYKRIAERSSSADKAFEDYAKASSAENRTGRTDTQLTTEAMKVFSETYPDSSELVNQVFDGWFTSEPRLNPNSEGQLMLDASVAYQDGYKIYGTAEGAEAYMQSALNDIWGITETRTIRDGNQQFAGEGVLMKYPPEKYYAAPDGDFDFLYKGVSDYAVAAGAQASNALLLADDITAKEVREGKAPTYQVIGMGEYGEAVVLPGRFGGEALRETAEEQITYNSMRTNAMEGVKAFSAAIDKATSKLQFLQNNGAPQAELDKASTELQGAMKGRQVAIETALANDQLDGTMPTSVDDPNFAKLVETATDTFANDSSLQRRAASLAKTYKGLDPAEANRKALSDIFGKDYGLTPEMSEALTVKVLENY